MRVFFATLIVLIVAFYAIKTTQTPNVSSVKAAQQAPKHEDMTKFSNDLEKFMTATAVKDGESADLINIKVTVCKPDQGEYGTRCWVTLGSTVSDKVEKATAENVRRRGAKFVWDHEA